MSEEHKHHNDLFQTNNQDDLLGETELHERSYPKTGDGGVYGDATAAVIEAQMEEYEKKEAKEHKNINVGELGALPSNAFALQEAKNDPQHAHTHKTDKETAATARVGAGGFALHDHHEKKEAKE